MTRPPKLYFLCRFLAPNKWECIGVLGNGFVFAEKICTNTCFAPGDLCTEPIKKALTKIFGIKTFWSQPIKVDTSAELLVRFQMIRSQAHVKKLDKFGNRFHKLVARTEIGQNTIKNQSTAWQEPR